MADIARLSLIVFIAALGCARDHIDEKGHSKDDQATTPYEFFSGFAQHQRKHLLLASTGTNHRAHRLSSPTRKLITLSSTSSSNLWIEKKQKRYVLGVNSDENTLENHEHQRFLKPRLDNYAVGAITEIKPQVTVNDIFFNHQARSQTRLPDPSLFEHEAAKVTSKVVNQQKRSHRKIIRKRRMRYVHGFNNDEKTLENLQPRLDTSTVAAHKEIKSQMTDDDTFLSQPTRSRSRLLSPTFSEYEAAKTMSKEVNRQKRALQSSAHPRKWNYKLRRSIQSDRCKCINYTCDCSHLNSSSVPEHLPNDTRVLDLSYNSIKILPNCSFRSYKALHQLNISFNTMTTLEADSFMELSELTHLILTGNWLHMLYNNSVSEDIFTPLINLLKLYIDEQIFYLHSKSLIYPDAALSKLQNLQELHMEGLNDTMFGKGFEQMTSLTTLFLSCSSKVLLFSLGVLQNATFQHLSQLTYLNLRGCSFPGHRIQMGTLAPLQNLSSLNISANQLLGMENLHRLMWGLRNSNLQELYMNVIAIPYRSVHLTSSMLRFLPDSIEHIEAQWDNIVTIERAAFDSFPKNLKYLDITNNVLLLDPVPLSLLGLQKLETLLMSKGSCDWFTLEEHFLLHQLTLSTLRHMTPKLPPNLKKIKMTAFEGYFLEFCGPSPNALEDVDLRCSSIPTLHLTSLKLPNLRHLDVSKSFVESMKYAEPNSTSPIPMETLILSSNLLGKFMQQHGKDRPFQLLSGLKYLDLSLNQITDLSANVFSGLDHLETLLLDRNPLSRFDVDLSNLSNLTTLNLSHTDVNHLTSEQRTHIDLLLENYTVDIDMSNCPIQCTCDTLDFLRWMVKSKAFDHTFSEYMCTYADSSTKYVDDGYAETIEILGKQCADNYPMFLIALVSTLIMLFGVIGSLIYRFRWTLRYWYYAAYNRLKERGEVKGPSQFLYDVFVSYDSEDQRFVTRTLSPELEQRGLNLLIHGRDFVAGTYIASNIVKAVAESRKTLVVLTRNLLESNWCNYEIQMATMESVYTGREVLMFLLKESIPNEELGTELLRHIRNSTYIPYPQSDNDEEIDHNVLQAFWDKLAHDLNG